MGSRESFDTESIRAVNGGTVIIGVTDGTLTAAGSHTPPSYEGIGRMATMAAVEATSEHFSWPARARGAAAGQQGFGCLPFCLFLIYIN